MSIDEGGEGESRDNPNPAPYLKVAFGLVPHFERAMFLEEGSNG